MDSVLLRYRYHDGTLQAAFPMHVVAEAEAALAAGHGPEPRRGC